MKNNPCWFGMSVVPSTFNGKKRYIARGRVGFVRVVASGETRSVAMDRVFNELNRVH